MGASELSQASCCGEATEPAWPHPIRPAEPVLRKGWPRKGGGGVRDYISAHPT